MIHGIVIYVFGVMLVITGVILGYNTEKKSPAIFGLMVFVTEGKGGQWGGRRQTRNRLVHGIKYRGFDYLFLPLRPSCWGRGEGKGRGARVGCGEG